MKYGANKFSKDDNMLSVDALKALTHGRIQDVCRRLESKGSAAAAFARKARASSGGADGDIMAGLIMDLVLWGPMMSHIGQGLGDGLLADAFNSVQGGMLLATGGELLCLLTDEENNALRGKGRRFLGGLYPYGRRQPKFVPKMNRRFNLLAANQNFSHDEEMEVGLLVDLLETLDKLSDRGVTAIRIDEKTSVYETLKKAHKGLNGPGVMKSYATAMRVAM